MLQNVNTFYKVFHIQPISVNCLSFSWSSGRWDPFQMGHRESGSLLTNVLLLLKQNCF